MPRAACLFALALAWPAAALAQEAAGLDFMLRGAQEPFGEPLAVAPSAAAPLPPLPRPIGPALAGPERGAPIGPALAGPAMMTAAPQRRPPTPRDDEEDPFAAPGIRLGSFVLRPSVDIGVTASDNVHSSQPRRSAVGWLVAPDVDLRSDWGRHEIAFELRGTAIFYGDDALDELEGEARLGGRYDVAAHTALEASLGAFRGMESFTDADFPAGAAERPAFRRLEAQLAGSHRLGRLGLRLGGRVARTEYEEVALAGGGAAALDDRNATETSLRLRTSYQVSPAVEPFVEAAAGRIAYERAVDRAGFRRSSEWRELVGGLIVDLGPKLSGEVAAGWRSESFDDPRLADLDGLVASAAILWSPRRLTHVRIELATDASGSTLSGVAGSLTHSALIAVEHRLRRDLALEAGLYATRERFVGLDRTDDTLGGYAELVYDLNRHVALIGRYRHERLESSAFADAEAENVVSVRVRLKR